MIDQFRGGGVMIGSVANGQVGLAPYHSLEKQIPDQIKKDMNELQQAIMANRITTGWPSR